MGEWGRVVAGRHLNAGVSTNSKGDVVVTFGLKKVKLDKATVAEWSEVRSQHIGLGQSVRKLGKEMWSGGSQRLYRGELHYVNILWADGTQSEVEMEHELFTQLSMVLDLCRAVPTTDRAATLPVGLPPPHLPVRVDREPDLIEQIAKLGKLRDQGILTEEEFAEKKAELLDRI